MRPQPDEEPTRRPEAVRKITKPRKVLKDILANISSESGSVKSSPNTRISSSSKKKPPNKTVSKLNGRLRSIGKKTDCTYDTNTCGHRSSDFMTPETINITVNKCMLILNVFERPNFTPKCSNFSLDHYFAELQRLNHFLKSLNIKSQSNDSIFLKSYDKII